MLNGLFFAALIAYFVATVLVLGGMVFKKEKITRLAKTKVNEWIENH